MTNIFLSENDTKKKLATDKRLASVREAIDWPRGTDVDNKVRTVVFGRDNYQICLSKPGKEAAPDYTSARYKDGRRGNNPNDMRPEILADGLRIEKNASFRDVFEELQKIHLQSIDGIRILACLLARSAYMADHVEIQPGVFRYFPQSELLSKLKELIPSAYEVPIEVFLHYLDALALNEDVKYFTLGYDIGNGTGRKNNLLTCVNVIGVLLGKVSIAKFAGDFSRPPVGISAISLKMVYEIFPELKDASNEVNSSIF